MEDEKIIEMYQERDETAIELTMQKYGTLCHSIAYSVLSDREDAEECVNDVWMKAWNSIPPLRPDNLKAWLGKVVRNLALDRWKKNRVKGKVNPMEQVFSMEQMMEELGECIPDNCNPENEVERSELIRYLERWLKKLPPDDSQLFLRRYWYGERVKDLADEWGESAAGVTMRLSRLRSKLKKSMEKEGISL